MGRSEVLIFPGMSLRELHVLEALFDDVDLEVGLTDEQVALRDKITSYYEKLAQYADLRVQVPGVRRSRRNRRDDG